MTFGSPLREYDTTVTVSNTVVVGGKDFYLWPGVSGEDLAPTLSTTAAYGRKDGGPCYNVSAGVNVAPVVTFNAAGRYGPDPAKTVMVIRAELWIAVGNSQLMRFGYGNPSASGTVSVGFSGTANVLVGGTSWTPDAGCRFIQGQWNTLELRSGGTITLNGNTVTRNNGTPLQLSAAAPPADTQVLTAETQASSGTNFFYVRNVYVTWEAP